MILVGVLLIPLLQLLLTISVLLPQMLDISVNKHYKLANITSSQNQILTYTLIKLLTQNLLIQFMIIMLMRYIGKSGKIHILGKLLKWFNLQIYIQILSMKLALINIVKTFFVAMLSMDFLKMIVTKQGHLVNMDVMYLLPYFIRWEILLRVTQIQMLSFGLEMFLLIHFGITLKSMFHLIRNT